MTDQCINVLIIEDNPGDARLVREALAGAVDPAYGVEWVDTLSTGLARLAHGGVDVLLLDLGLRDSQGLATLSRVQASAPAVPIVVLSGVDDEQFAVEAVREGAQDYIAKNHIVRHLLTRSMRYAIQRKWAAEALRTSEERLRLAVAAANESIWEYDAVRGTRWNKEYDSPSSAAPGTVTSVDLCCLRIHHDDQEAVSRSFAKTLEEGQALTWSAEYRLERADGDWSHVQDRAVIARDSSGKVTRVIGAMLDVTDLKGAEEALWASNRRLQQLSRDLLRAQDDERRRIARELHDGTAQLLTALGLNLARLRLPGLDPDRQKQLLSEAAELVAASAAEIQSVTCLLHPPVLNEVGLSSGLKTYAQGFSQRTRIQVEVEIAPDFGRLNNELETTLFRIVQEGLANVRKHSGSSLAVVRLERDLHEVRLSLQDRGRGLLDAVHDQSEGFVRFGIGIIGMRERAEQLGGRVELASNDIGATLTVTLPLVYSSEENTNTVSR